MTDAAVAVDTVPVALLGRDDACRSQLRQALVELGAEIVHEGDLLGADCAGIAGSRPAVVLINLEAGSEDALDALDPLLADPAINVVFNEAESTSQLSGWDLARWARHLAAKVLGHGRTVPPPPPGAEHLPLKDLQPRPGAPLTPAQEIGDVPLDRFAAEAADSEFAVPASRDLAAEQHSQQTGGLAGGDLPAARDTSPAAAIGDDAEALPVRDDTASFGDSDAAPVAVAVVRDLHEDHIDDDFQLDLGEIELALAGLDTPSAASDGSPRIERAAIIDDAGFDPAVFDSALEVGDGMLAAETSEADAAMSSAVDAIYDPDAADVDLSLDPAVAALAAQLDAQQGGSLELESDALDFELAFDASSVANEVDIGEAGFDNGLELGAGLELGTDIEPVTELELDIALDAPESALDTGMVSTATEAGFEASVEGLPSLDFELPSLAIEPSAPAADASKPIAGAPELADARSALAAVDAPASSGGSLFGDLALAPIDGDQTPASPAPATTDDAFDFSSLSLSLEPIDAADGEPAVDIVAESVTDTVASDPAPSAVHAIPRVFVLGASIGGPDAVRTFLSGLPADFPGLFLLAQHLDNGFFSRLATQLQKISKLPVRVADDGEGPVAAGQVVVVPSNQRYRFGNDGQIEPSEHEAPPRYKPCIDDLMRDASDVFGDRVTAIIFSGMAGDAIEGAVHVTARGGEVWAQEPESCVVSSMVDGARARGVVEFVGSPRELAEQCVTRYGVRG